MTCQCEIYEICPECAPSREAFLKAASDHDDVIRQHRVSPSKSYTLDELERLAREFNNEQEHQDEHPIGLQLVLSLFLAWARKREREVGDATV